MGGGKGKREVEREYVRTVRRSLLRLISIVCPPLVLLPPPLAFPPFPPFPVWGGWRGGWYVGWGGLVGGVDARTFHGHGFFWGVFGVLGCFLLALGCSVLGVGVGG